MTVKSLNTQTSSDVPCWDGFIGTCSCQQIWIRLEMDRVDRVHMTSQNCSTLSDVYVQQSAWMVHWTRCNIISSCIQINRPNWLAMILESKGTRSVDKVPNFNRWISTCCHNVKTFWMKLHRTYPIFMTLAWHDELRLTYGPNFPKHIIRARTNDRFFRMKYNWADGHLVCFLSLGKDGLLVGKGLKIACQIRID